MQPIELLWIDDEIDLLQAHILFLSQKGYNVHKAHSGQDALTMVEAQPSDVVLLDENIYLRFGINELGGILPLAIASLEAICSKLLPISGLYFSQWLSIS